MASHGFLDKFQEYWIERMVGDVKDSIHGNAKHHVESTYVRVHLCRRGATKSRYVPSSHPLCQHDLLQSRQMANLSSVVGRLI